MEGQGAMGSEFGTNIVLVDVHGGSGDKTNLVHDLGYINIHACPCWEFPIQPDVTVAGGRWIPQYNGSKRGFIVTWQQKIHFSLFICQRLLLLYSYSYSYYNWSAIVPMFQHHPLFVKLVLSTTKALLLVHAFKFGWFLYIYVY